LSGGRAHVCALPSVAREFGNDGTLNGLRGAPMNSDSQFPTDCVSIDEFAARVGFSVPTVRRRIRDGAIRICQPGGPGTRLSIPLSELTRLLEQTSDAGTATNARPSARKPIAGPQPKWKQSLSK